MKTRHDLLHLDYTVIAEPAEEAPDHVMRFRVYSIMCKPGEPGSEFEHKKIEWCKEVGTHNEPTDNIDDATIFLEGSVKWDGCSNWKFPDAVHFCERSQMIGIGEVLAFCFDLAAKTIPDSICR